MRRVPDTPITRGAGRRAPGVVGFAQRAMAAVSGGRVGISRDLSTDAARMNADFNQVKGEAVQFGPGAPPIPQPLDASNQPRAFQYRPYWNYPTQPGESRPLDLGTLRQLADTYDILRKAIEVRKDEIAGLKFDVIARETDRKRARQVIESQQDKIVEIRAFFDKPDRRTTFQSWLRMLLEDYFVVDAVTIWKWRRLDGSLYGLRLLDGSTIKPLLDIQGERPLPPDPAYEQYLFGIVRDSFTTEEMIYAPKNRRVHRVYGFSPVEQFLTHINLALRFQRFTTDFFTDGTLPEGVATAPADWTSQQIEEFNEYWDRMLAGDSRALHKLHFVPEGFKFELLKPWSFDDRFARWLVGVTCAAMDISPLELGFEPDHGGLGGKGIAEEQSTILKRKATGPLIRWLCDEIFNPIIWEEFGATDLQATFTDQGEGDEALQAMQARDLAIRNGSLSIDQAVEEDGGEPPGIGRIMVVGNMVLGEPDLILLTKGGKAALDGASAAAVAQAKPTPTVLPALPASSAAAPSAGTLQTRSEERNLGSTESPAATKAAADQFMRFVAKRRGGAWRDYQSDVLPTGLLADLNLAAKAGASADELRTLIGLQDQPETFKSRAKALGKANLDFNQRLAARVSETIAQAAR